MQHLQARPDEDPVHDHVRAPPGVDDLSVEHAPRCPRHLPTRAADETLRGTTMDIVDISDTVLAIPPTVLATNATASASVIYVTHASVSLVVVT